MVNYLKGIFGTSGHKLDIDIKIKAVSKAVNGHYKDFIYTLHCHDLQIVKANKDVLRIYYYDDLGYVKRRINMYSIIDFKIISINGLTYHGAQPNLNNFEFEVIKDE